MEEEKVVDMGFELPKLLSDGMVLQREQNIKLWGRISEGKNVSITFGKHTYSTVGNGEGKWEITLPSMAAGGPYKMLIEADRIYMIKDILVGDVWLCGGQSNMELPIARVMERYKEEVENYENPMIRLFHVPLKYVFDHQEEDFEEGRWQTLNQENVQDFNAVGYFFAKALFEKHHVPIGLIQSAIGGTPAQAWMSHEALEAFPVYVEQVAKYQETGYAEKVLAEDATRISNWYQKANGLDLGIREQKWYDTDYVAEGWKNCEMPEFLGDKELGDGGYVWFRKEFEVPSTIVGKEGRLLLGTIVDNDTAYINGVQVGTTGYRYPPRIYPVAEGVLKEGKNVLVVRVGFERHEVGFTPEKALQLEVGQATIDLGGTWCYKIGAKTEAMMPQIFLQYEPTGLYNGMLYPLKNMGLKGVIWYQGESNTGHTEDYKDLCESLIQDWRKLWQMPNLPFMYVQLPGFGSEDYRSSWANLRQAQLETLEVPHTAMVVAIDTGEQNDLHPLNKKDIGERLALAARGIAYDEDLVYSSPLAESARLEEDKVIISFSHIGSGLMVKGEVLNQFIVSEDGVQFHKAEAMIKENEVVVWHEQIKSPVEVRYAWADNPTGANLYNQEGLPASPFAIKIS